MADKERRWSEEKVDLKKRFSELEPPFRVLAMDAGGIYGTFSAIMLRKLCERDENFLKNDQVTLFAGSSAGAINALILAKEDNPRDAVLKERKLERFFKDSRVYSNRKNPVAGALSLVGLASWSGEADFYSVLEDYFGEMKMKDLKHRVMITAFDLRGKPEDVFGQREWQPRIFYNFPDGEADRELYVKDVAYGAASPPTLRPVRNGITDGGFFASDPTAFAIAKIVLSERTEQVHPLVDQVNRIGEAFTKIEQQPQRGRIAYLLSPEDCEVVRGCLTRMLLPESGKQISDRGELEEKREDLSPTGQYQKLQKDLVEKYKALKEDDSRGKSSSDTGWRAKSAMFWFPPSELIKNDGLHKKVKEAVENALKLAEWEYEFWEALTKAIATEDLSGDVKQLDALLGHILHLYDRGREDVKEKLEKVEQVLTGLPEPNDGQETQASGDAKETDAKSKDKWHKAVRELQYSLQRLELLRRLLYESFMEQPEELLKHISVLSVGLGAKRPNYFLENFDFGPLQFLSLPTNYWDKFFASPLMSFLANPAKDTTRFQAKSLLGENDYFRLDPPIIGFPVPSVTSAAYLARNPLVREYILKKFYEIADSRAVEDQILETEKWKERAGWAPKKQEVA
ncbi:MAG: patatin-like phospholipase family protein [Betaproteobacteria bacterium]|nr:MAG: patatin-like phospholipase family protein [Betaproteobacteria bacterium]